MGCVKTWGRRSAPAAATVEDVGVAVCAGGDGRETASSPPLPSPFLPRHPGGALPFLSSFRDRRFSRGGGGGVL